MASDARLANMNTTTSEPRTEPQTDPADYVPSEEDEQFDSLMAAYFPAGATPPF
jgi:hypothetical protein